MKTIKNLFFIFVIIVSMNFVSCTNEPLDSGLLIQEPSMILVSCPQPTNIVTSSIDINSELISWNSGGSESQWEILIIPENYPVPLNTQIGIPVTGNTYIVTGLFPNTTYHCYIRAKCSATDVSEWTGPAIIN
jgi:glucose dehydrogenase